MASWRECTYRCCRTYPLRNSARVNKNTTLSLVTCYTRLNMVHSDAPIIAESSMETEPCESTNLPMFR